MKRIWTISLAICLAVFAAGCNDSPQQISQRDEAAIVSAAAIAALQDRVIALESRLEQQAKTDAEFRRLTTESVSATIGLFETNKALSYEIYKALREFQRAVYTPGQVPNIASQLDKMAGILELTVDQQR